MLRAIDEFGTTGQPIWPVLAASAHGHFLSGTTPGALPPVAAALVHATPLGWGLSLRLTRLSEPSFASGPWGSAWALVSPGWMAQPAFSEADCPLEPRHQFALAALMGLMASTHLIPSGSASLLLRVPDIHATRALRLGSSPDSALQDIVMLFTTACMELRMPRPWILEAAPPRPPAPLSTADQLTACADSANAGLRHLVRDLARHAGYQLTIDLFASSPNAQCSRFYSLHPEPASAGVDALAQDTWSSSHCPWCQARRPEFCLLFPPFPLIRAALLKARADQAHGIAIVPCAHTAPWWPTLSAASLTKPSSFEPYFRLPSHTHLNHCTSAPGFHHAILHFDFWNDQAPRPRACTHGHLPRCSHPASAAADSADHRAICRSLDSLALPNTGCDPPDHKRNG
jgi:hypothetical protein